MALMTEPARAWEAFTFAREVVRRADRLAGFLLASRAHREAWGISDKPTESAMTREALELASLIKRNASDWGAFRAVERNHMPLIVGELTLAIEWAEQWALDAARFGRLADVGSERELARLADSDAQIEDLRERLNWLASEEPIASRLFDEPEPRKLFVLETCTLEELAAPWPVEKPARIEHQAEPTRTEDHRKPVSGGRPSMDARYSQIRKAWRDWLAHRCLQEDPPNPNRVPQRYKMEFLDTTTAKEMRLTQEELAKALRKRAKN